MQIYDSDFQDDSLNEIHSIYNFNDPPSNKNIYQTKKVKPVVCYDLIDITDNSKYSFNQPCFDSKDAFLYFQRMKDLCMSSIEHLISEGGFSWHLRPTKGKNITKEIARIAGKRRITQIPEIMHFALYTSNERASREKGIKSPRIHFLIGNHGMIYPIFYDPYHEMNP